MISYLLLRRKRKKLSQNMNLEINTYKWFILTFLHCTFTHSQLSPLSRWKVCCSNSSKPCPVYSSYIAIPRQIFSENSNEVKNCFENLETLLTSKMKFSFWLLWHLQFKIFSRKEMKFHFFFSFLFFLYNVSRWQFPILQYSIFQSFSIHFRKNKNSLFVSQIRKFFST